MLYPKIVIKIGTNTIQTNSHLNEEIMFDLAQQIYRLKIMGHKVILVSSGAIACGKRYLSNLPSWEQKIGLQALACLGQPDLINMWKMIFSQFGIVVGQLLYENYDFLENNENYLSTQVCLEELLSLNFLPVVNENDAVTRTEINEMRSFGDNCQLALCVAKMIGANLNIMLTNVDGYLDQNGQVIPEIENVDYYYGKTLNQSKSANGTGGIIAHLKAAQNAQQNNITTIIANGNRKNILLDIVQSLQCFDYQRRHPFTIIRPLKS
ncbi:MAG: glutamate 5-kinase [Patescibacteria group bacterium]|nr:glutamate 5-kinase [Patescibacteria group bacterium]